MNGFRNSSRNGQVWRWQRAGSRAVILEVSGRWMEAAEAWRRAAGVAPRTDWQQFARKRAEHCHRRSRKGVTKKAAFITPGIQKAE
ncbi:ANR family transcriptional regulator (plasmid) [Escherichia coli]|nr:ANR family transcriptional regulator [Escherichia coli]HCP2810799.1 ANR family transcriptional regulator [Escherichia coli]HCP2826101.1 ANR family transcriptional regulator [Escherichia coli]